MPLALLLLRATSSASLAGQHSAVAPSPPPTATCGSRLAARGLIARLRLRAALPHHAATARVSPHTELLPSARSCGFHLRTRPVGTASIGLPTGLRFRNTRRFFREALRNSRCCGCTGATTSSSCSWLVAHYCSLLPRRPHRAARRSTRLLISSSTSSCASPAGAELLQL
jgi:hypothetical protein